MYVCTYVIKMRGDTASSLSD